MFRFLLRFFAVFIASSAFVGLASRPVFAYQVGGGDSASPTPNCPDSYNGLCGEIGSNESSAPCDENPLTFDTVHHENYGTYILTAQYVKTPYTAYYRKGTCGGEDSYKDSNNYGYYEEYYSVLDLAGAGMSLPGGHHAFNGWSACWYDCDTDSPTESNCLSSPSVGTLQPGTENFNWSNDKCLLLVGNCTAQDTYTITYKAGTCGSDPGYVVRTSDPQTVDTQFDARSDTAMAESELTVPAVTNFHGWTESSNPIVENGVLQNEWDYSNPITMTRNIVVYAACTPNQYAVVYDPGTCTGKNYSDSATGGQSYTVKDITDLPAETVSAQANKHFVGWTVCWHDATSNVCDDTMSPSGPFNTPKDSSNWTFTWNNDAVLTLYGKCEEDAAYEVLFDCLNGTTSPVDEDDDGENLYKDSTLTVLNGETLCGSGFTEWSCTNDTDGQTVPVSNDVLTMPASDVTCNANYEYKVWYYCDEDAMAQNNNFGTGVAGYQESYTWEGPDILENQCSSHSNQEFANKWVCDLELGQVNAGYTANYNYTQDMKCYALWEDKQYTITYNVVLPKNQGNTWNYEIYSTKNGINTNRINWKNNPDTYVATDNINLVQPENNNTDGNGYSIIGNWYECDENGAPVNTSYIKNIVGDLQGNMRNLNLCIITGWKITYYGCSNGTIPCTGGNKTNMNNLIPDGVGPNDYESFNVNKLVFFPAETGDGYGKFNISNSLWPTSNRTWVEVMPEGNPNGRWNTSGIDHNLTLWTLLTNGYIVTYNCAEGSGGPYTDGPHQKTNIKTKTSDACSYEEGWTFTWDCGGSYNDVTPGGWLYVDSNKTCNAEWKCANGYVLENGQCVKKYSLKYNCANGTQGVLSDGTEYSGTETNVPLWAENNSNPPTKVGSCNVPSGKHFDKWTCNNNVTVNDNNTINMKKADITCTANWLGNDYKVIYNCNDGNTQIGFKSGVDWSLSDGKDKVTFNSTQYTFKVATDTCEAQNNKTVTGWSCSASGTPWTGSKTWNIPNDVTCNAIWSNLYSLTYDCGEGTGDPSGGNRNNISANTKLNTLTVSESTCTNPGKEFEWSCDGETIVPGNQITINANRHCTAIWGNKKYTLTYDCANGDAAGDGEERHEYRELISGLETKKNCVVPSDTQEFDYWTCEPVTSLIESSNGSNNKISSFRMPDEDVTCTAHWKNKKYSVRYDCTQGQMKSSISPDWIGGVPGKDSFEYEASYAFRSSDNTCESSTHELLGWKCTKEGDDTVNVTPWFESTTWKIPFNVVCKAEWDNLQYRLDYDCKNGTNTLTDSENPYDAGESATILGYSNCGVKNGFVLTHWNCVPNGGTPVDKVPGNTIAMNANTICNAVWEKEQYAVRYDCTQGQMKSSISPDWIGGVPGKDSFEYEASYAFRSSDNTCESSTHELLGWKCTKEGDDTVNVTPWFESTTWKIPFNVVCKAEWDNLQYRLDYDCKNGTNTLTDSENPYDAGESATILGYSNCGVKNGFVLTHWNCVPNGGTPVDKVPGNTIAMNANTICNAVWVETINRIIYRGCVDGDCVHFVPLNGYVEDSTKLTYGENHVVYFDVNSINGERLKAEQKYSFDGIWFKNITNHPGIWHTKGQTDDPLIVYTNLKPYYDVTYDCGWEHLAPVDENNPYVSGSKVSVKNSSTCGDGARDGYTFINWSCKPDGQSAFDVAGSGGTFNITADTTCTAVWDGNSYKIIYRGGTAGTRPVTQIAMANQPVQFGEENVKLRGNTYSINGYSFSGWVCEAKIDTSNSVPEEILQNLPEGVSSENITITGTNRTTYTCPDVIAGRSYNIGTYRWISDMVCTAQWTPRNYNIIYNKGSCDGTSYTNYDSLTYDDTYSVLGLDDSNMTVVAPVGYVFTGWRTVDTVIQNPDRIPGQTYGPWTTAGDLNLYATCEREPYHVTYDCDTSDEDSVTPVDEKSYYVDNTVSLKQNTCKKTGWSPLGWDCHPLASETSIGSMSNSLPTYDDNTFSMPADNVKCDMRWEQDVYHVTYECRGDADCDSAGSNCQTPQDDQGYNYGESVTTATNTCTKAGHDFVKWNCAGQDVGAGRDFDIYDNTLCYAVWNPKQYNIKYQSGNCESRDTHVTQIDYSVLTYGQNFTVGDVSDSGVNVRNGYEFLGWSTSLVTDEDLEINSFESEYVSGQTYGPWVTDDDLILHAVCKKKIYNICYDFQVQGAGWKDENANPLYSYDVDTEMGSREVFLAVENNKEGNFYVFDGWYNTPGIYHNQNDTEIEITSVPSTYAEPLDAPVSVKCDETISAQCDESGYAKCDVVLYAKWRDAGKILFDCGEDNYFRKKSAVGSLVKAFDPELIGGCVPEGCNFGIWHCENYTGSPKDYTPIEDYIKVLVANTTVVCTPVKDCSNVKYNIEYHVYQNGVKVSEVYANNGQDRVSVDDLKPDTYSPGDEPVAYPVVSWPDCRFTGWYENPEFTGATVTHTPALASDEEGEDIYLYGQMICETMCNEPGHEHWLHIGDNPDDKVCLYEKRPTTQTPAVRVKGHAAEPYYMMLSTNPDMVIHEGSEKSMRIQHKNGTVYNVCDKSSCPELAK